MATLESVDAEIKRITLEIERLQKEVERPPSPKGREGMLVPDFGNLPDLNNVPLPKGFQRAPVTCPYDPAKGERLAALEAELREQLLSRNKEDSLALLRRILKHQAVNKIEYEPSQKNYEKVSTRLTGNIKDELSDSVLQFLIPSIR